MFVDIPNLQKDSGAHFLKTSHGQAWLHSKCSAQLKDNELNSQYDVNVISLNFTKKLW